MGIQSSICVIFYIILIPSDNKYNYTVLPSAWLKRNHNEYW